MAKQDYLDDFNHVIDFDEHDNDEIVRAVVDQTKRQYAKALALYGRCVYLSLIVFDISN